MDALNKEVVKLMAVRTKVTLYAYPGDAEVNARNHTMITADTEYPMGLERENNVQRREGRQARTLAI